MKVKEFLSVLENNLNKELLFEHTNGKFVGANYHLTEVKNVYFDTVDCGGKPNDWRETHLQLWESPKEIGKTNYMTVDKIVSILNRVNSIKTIDTETSVKIEYGNDEFNTAVMDIDHIELTNNRVIAKLYTEATLCKANIGGNDFSSKNEVKEEACCAEVGCC